RPAPRFDVIAPQPARGPTEPCAALDAKSRRPGAGDADAELLQELAQLDDVRLARSVSNLGNAARRRGREKRSLSDGHRRFEDVHRGRLQTVGRLEMMIRTVDLSHAHRGEHFEVNGERSAGW